jgi:hypothetical protein
MAAEGFGVKMEPNRPRDRCEGEGREQSAGQSGCFGVAVSVADRILQEIGARGEKYREQEKRKVLFLFLMNHFALQWEQGTMTRNLVGSYTTRYVVNKLF